MSFASSTPQGLVDPISGGPDSNQPTSQDSIIPSPQGLTILSSQASTGSIPQGSIIPSSQDPPQDSTLPSSQGSIRDSTISTPQDSTISSAQCPAIRSSRDSTVPTIDESTAQISQVTELIQTIKQHIGEENTALMQASLDHILLQTTNLVFDKQLYLQELANKSVEIEKKNDNIKTLSGEIDVKDTTIRDLQTQIKENKNTLLEKSDAITKLNKINAMRENRIKELEAQIESKDAALQQKSDAIAEIDKSNTTKDNNIKELETQLELRVRTIKDVYLSNSTKDNRIKQLETQIWKRDNSITALECKLTENMIRRERLEQQFEHLGKKMEGRQDSTLHDMAISIFRPLRATRRPVSTSPSRYHTQSTVSSDQGQDILSDPQNSQESPFEAPKVTNDFQTAFSSDQSQSHDILATPSPQPAKAASISWSITTTDPQHPRLPRVREEIDTQLHNEGIHGWLSGFREPEMRPICSRLEDRQIID